MSFYEKLKSDVQKQSALRVRTRLEPAGGDGDKVFPVTHEGGTYAWEERTIEGTTRDCVLLNSVQAEANLHELALLHQADDLKLPLIVAEIPGEMSITSFEAPHRAFDAIFRDCEHESKAFYAGHIVNLLQQLRDVKLQISGIQFAV